MGTRSAENAGADASGQAKIEKRARRDLYEGSKLLDQHRKQVSLAFPQTTSRTRLIDPLVSKITRKCS